MTSHDVGESRELFLYHFLTVLNHFNHLQSCSHIANQEEYLLRAWANTDTYGSIMLGTYVITLLIN
jgi:hypothetical protein